MDRGQKIFWVRACAVYLVSWGLVLFISMIHSVTNKEIDLVSVSPSVGFLVLLALVSMIVSYGLWQLVESSRKLSTLLFTLQFITVFTFGLAGYLSMDAAMYFCIITLFVLVYLNDRSVQPLFVNRRR